MDVAVIVDRHERAPWILGLIAERLEAAGLAGEAQLGDEGFPVIPLEVGQNISGALDLNHFRPPSRSTLPAPGWLHRGAILSHPDAGSVFGGAKKAAASREQEPEARVVQLAAKLG
jgi:hypothetical protein